MAACVFSSLDVLTKGVKTGVPQLAAFLQRLSEFPRRPKQ